MSNLEARAPGGSPSRGLPARASPSEIDELARKLLAVAAIRVAVVTLSLGALFISAQLNLPSNGAETQSWEYGLIGVTYALSLLFVLFLRYRILVPALAWAQVAIDASIVSVLVLMTGGVESIFAVAYVFTVLGASITLFRRGAVAAAITTFLMFGTVLVLQLDRTLAILPPVQFGNAVFSFFMHSVGMALVALLSSTLSEKARLTGRLLEEKESTLERLEELHAAILRSLPAGLMTVGGDGSVRYANDSALGILRRSADQVIGRPLGEVVPVMGALWEKRRSSNLPEKARERFEGEHRLPDGDTSRLGYSFATLAQIGSGVGTLVVFQDVTEIVRLEEAVERAERLATVGKFAAGLAHEVRNPLAAMCASIHVLETSLQPPEPMRRLMENVVKEAERLNSLIGDFLAFARPRSLSLRSTELGALVGSVLDVFEHDALMRGRRVHRSLPPGVMAAVDQDLLRQVVWNLVRNAAEATAQHGEVFVILRSQESGAVLEVRDTGPGMSSERQQRIFDPFFTTKERGSGLGLPISHSIVEAHGAELTLTSKEGEGTRVSIQFRPDLHSLDLEMDVGSEGRAHRGTSDTLELLGGTL